MEVGAETLEALAVEEEVFWILVPAPLPESKKADTIVLPALMYCPSVALR